jgi:hypothetical protein
MKDPRKEEDEGDMERFDLASWLPAQPAAPRDDRAFQAALLADYDRNRRRRSPLRRLAEAIGAPAFAPRFAPAGALAGLTLAGVAVGSLTAPREEGYLYALAALEEETMLWDAE